MNSRVGTSKKAQWIADYNAFIKKENLLEKEITTKLFGKKYDLPAYAQSLLSFQTDIEKQRATEERSVQSHLEKIKVSVERLKIQTRAKTKDETYVTALENLMNYIEQEIVSFKSLQRERREELNVDEMALDRECGMFEKRIDNIESEEIAIRIESDDTKNIPKVPKTNFNKINEAVPPEVIALQAYLQETGVTGGWPEKDHQLFVHIRNQCRGNIQQLAERCVYEIPEKDYAMVEDHEQWFSTYNSLLKAQKTAILRWKANREAIKATDLQLEEEDLARKAEQVKVKEKQQRQLEKEHELQLIHWKEEKKKREEEEKEKSRMDEERKIEEDKQREIRRRAIIKDRLQEHMAQKEEEDRNRQMEIARKQIIVSHKVTAKDLEKFQEKDRLTVLAKQHKAQKIDEERAEKESRLEKMRKQVSVTAPRDPSRLTKPTAAFEVRVNEVEQKGLYPNMDFNGPFATRRAIPAWRQGL